MKKVLIAFAVVAVAVAVIFRVGVVRKLVTGVE
jgi:hypothetical protein